MSSRFERSSAAHRMRKRHKAMSASLIVGAHVALVFALWNVLPPPAPREADPDAVMVTFATPPPPPAPPPKPAQTSAPKAPPAPAQVVKTAPRPPATPVRVRQAVAPERAPQTLAATPAAVQVGPSDADLAGAATAGSGSGGGGDGGDGAGSCDMIGRLQAALRRDARIQAAIAGAHQAAGGRALQVWNGEWVQSSGEDGKGLAGLRQAITVAVAFAPEACRRKPMHGLVLISLKDGPGAPRVVLGAGAWRWSDLLFAAGARAPRV